MEETESQLKSFKENHQEELSRLAREHEDKILFLLRQMPKSKDVPDASETKTEDSEDDAIVERLRFQEEELAKMSHLHELLQKKTEQCDQLMKDMDKIKNTPVSVS